MGHGHHHHSKDQRLFILSIILTLSFAIVEAIFGWFSHSLALLSDAGHMAADSFALGIAAFAAWIASRPATAKHSYGLGRAEIFAAWISSILLLILSLVIMVEAISRFNHATPVKAQPVMIVAAIGLVINLVLAWLLSHTEETLNSRAALLHVISDLLGSICAFIAGAVIYFTGWQPIDPILSILISLLILFSCFRLLRDSMQILMEGTPKHLNLQTIANLLLTVDGVKQIHDLHVWHISSASSEIILTAHIHIKDLNQWPTLFNQMERLLLDTFKIQHITLQPDLTEKVSSHPRCISYAKAKD